MSFQRPLLLHLYDAKSTKTIQDSKMCLFHQDMGVNNGTTVTVFWVTADRDTFMVIPEYVVKGKGSKMICGYLFLGFFFCYT